MSTSDASQVPTHQYGRRTPKNAAALNFAKYLAPAATIPPHPAAEDYLARLRGGWAMLGNDQEGDCVAVTWANFRRLMTALYGTREVYPTLAEVIALYKTQNPRFDVNGTARTNGPGSSADGGMDIQTVLEYLSAHGGPDGVKPVCFGKIDAKNLDAVQAALHLFVGVWVGVTVTAANENQFDAGQAWDYNPSSQELGGHSILAGGYMAAGVNFITWAEETAWTAAFQAHQVDEVWVVVWPEHMTDKRIQEGVNLAALAADYTALTRRPFPVDVPPTPAPTPAPVPVPVPDVDQALADALTRYARTHTSPKYLLTAANAWMAAR